MQVFTAALSGIVTSLIIFFLGRSVPSDKELVYRYHAVKIGSETLQTLFTDEWIVFIGASSALIETHSELNVKRAFIELLDYECSSYFPCNDVPALFYLRDGYYERYTGELTTDEQGAASVSSFVRRMRSVVLDKPLGRLDAQLYVKLALYTARENVYRLWEEFYEKHPLCAQTVAVSLFTFIALLWFLIARRKQNRRS